MDEEVYFFDEPTSNLDIESEEKIINIIKKYLKDKTYIIITHRHKLIDLCDKQYQFRNHRLQQVSYENII